MVQGVGGAACCLPGRSSRPVVHPSRRHGMDRDRGRARRLSRPPRFGYPEVTRGETILKAVLLSVLIGMMCLAGARAQEVSLLVYTSQPQTDAQQTIDAFKARHPKLAVSFIRDGTPRLMAKLN